MVFVNGFYRSKYYQSIVRVIYTDASIVRLQVIDGLLDAPLTMPLEHFLNEYELDG